MSIAIVGLRLKTGIRDQFYAMNLCNHKQNDDHKLVATNSTVSVFYLGWMLEVHVSDMATISKCLLSGMGTRI